MRLPPPPSWAIKKTRVKAAPALKPSKKAVPTEHSEQSALFSWAALSAARWPGLSLLFAVPMGGARNAITGARLRAEGAKAGIPDCCLPVAAGDYHGLFIEMKRTKGGKVSPEQKWWIAALRAQGYRVEVCKGFDEARAVIIDYLKGGQN